MGRISLLSLAFLLLMFILFKNNIPEKNIKVAGVYKESKQVQFEEKSSYVDFLYLKLETKNHAKIAVIGSSVTAGSGASNYKYSWVGRLENNLSKKNQKFNTLEFVNHGKRRYSTTDLLEHGIVENLIHNQPDLVIFETAIINNHGHSIPMEQTLHDIKTIVKMVETRLPQSKIIVTSPNPISARAAGKAQNEIGLSYHDYLLKTKQFIESNGWSYVDVYEGMEEVRKKEGFQLDEILKDGIHPNDKGYQFWFEIINDYLYEK